MLFYMLLRFTLRPMALLGRYKDSCKTIYLFVFLCFLFIFGFVIFLLFSEPFLTFFCKRRICTLTNGTLTKLILKSKNSSILFGYYWILKQELGLLLACLVQETTILLLLSLKVHNVTNAVALTMITDGLDSYHMPLMLAYLKSKHPVYSSLCDDVDNHVIESFHKTFKS